MGEVSERKEASFMGTWGILLGMRTGAWDVVRRLVGRWFAGEMRLDMALKFISNTESIKSAKCLNS